MASPAVDSLATPSRPPPVRQGFQRPALPPRPPTKLQAGDIVAFSTSPAATAAEYGTPHLNPLLQQLLYGKYIGVVLSSTIIENPSVIEGHALPGVPMEVELLRLAYVGSTPPENTMLDSQELLPLLPGGSMAFATIQLLRSDSTDDPAKPTSAERPPLRAVGSATLPFPISFVHTTSSTKAHLSTVNKGATSLRLAEGELDRLAQVASADTGTIAGAGDQFRKMSARPSQPIVVQKPQIGDQDHATTSGFSGSEYPSFSHAVVDVWTDLGDVIPLGEPSAFEAELVEIERAIEESYKEAPIVIEDWVGETQREAHSPYYSPSKAFGLGMGLGIGIGILGVMFFRHVRQLR